MKELFADQRQKFLESSKVAVLIGHKIVQLNGIDSSSFDVISQETTITGPSIAVRNDIDLVAFRQAVLDLYANFPSTR